MRIAESSNLNNEYTHRFDYVYRVYPSNDNEMKDLDAQIKDKLGYWLQEFAIHNYIMLEIVSKTIGGGFAMPCDHSYSAYFNDEDNKYRDFSHYEIRMHKDDAINFKLTWM